MNDDDKKQAASFDASLPLPDEANSTAAEDSLKDPATELIRKKVEAAYSTEPNLEAEVEEIEELGPAIKLSKHQQFIYNLTNSGKSLEEINAAWHEYYAGLTDLEKHQIWQEFYSTHAQASHYAAAVPSMAPQTIEPIQTAAIAPVPPATPIKPLIKTPKSLGELPTVVIDKLKNQPRLRASQHLQSLVFGLGLGCIVILIFLFGFFNERFVAPFIQPSRTISNTPIISGDEAISSVDEIVIPKINVEIPVVYGINTIDESAVDNALENGVVHYADTAMPGQNGNLVIVGHSSNNIFNKGKYKFAFVLLSRLDKGDTFYIQKDGKRYTYQVYQKHIVSPTDVSVLGPAQKQASATLITCDPPGTSANRLVVTGEQINPDPIANAPAATENTVATSSRIIPGNSPSLWSRLIHLF